MSLKQVYKKYTTHDVSQVVQAASTLLTMYGREKQDKTTFRRGQFFIQLEHRFILLTPVICLSIYYNNHLVFYFKDVYDFTYEYGEWVGELFAYAKE